MHASNIQEKAPMVAEPSQRLIPLELSRDRRDSGGAHAVSNACDAAFYLQRRSPRSQRRSQRLRSLRFSLRRQRLRHLLPLRLRVPVRPPSISSPPFRVAILPCGQLTPWWQAGRCYLRRVTSPTSFIEGGTRQSHRALINEGSLLLSEEEVCAPQHLVF